MKRALTLSRERLADLTPAELSEVAGAGLGLPSGLTCPLEACFVESNLGPCYSWLC